MRCASTLNALLSKAKKTRSPTSAGTPPTTTPWRWSPDGGASAPRFREASAKGSTGGVLPGQPAKPTPRTQKSTDDAKLLDLMMRSLATLITNSDDASDFWRNYVAIR